jgi:hypothetical protein
MGTFLQNCPRDYDDSIELQTNKLAQKLMNQKVQTVGSLQECVGQGTKTQKKRVDETEVHAVSCRQTRQSILCLTNTSTKCIQKQDHVDKPRGQKICKKQDHVDKHHVDKSYARNKCESNHVNTRLKQTDSSYIKFYLKTQCNFGYTMRMKPG